MWSTYSNSGVIATNFEKKGVETMVLIDLLGIASGITYLVIVLVMIYRAGTVLDALYCSHCGQYMQLEWHKNRLLRKLFRYYRRCPHIQCPGVHPPSIREKLINATIILTVIGVPFYFLFFRGTLELEQINTWFSDVVIFMCIIVFIILNIHLYRAGIILNPLYCSYCGQHRELLSFTNRVLRKILKHKYHCLNTQCRGIQHPTLAHKIVDLGIFMFNLWVVSYVFLLRIKAVQANSDIFTIDLVTILLGCLAILVVWRYYNRLMTEHKEPSDELIDVMTEHAFNTYEKGMKAHIDRSTATVSAKQLVPGKTESWSAFIKRAGVTDKAVMAPAVEASRSATIEGQTWHKDENGFPVLEYNDEDDHSSDPWKGKKQVFCPLCGEKIPMTRYDLRVSFNPDGLPGKIWITGACASCIFSGNITTAEVNRSYYENKIKHYSHEI